MLLPLWLKQGRPVPIPFLRNRPLPLPVVPLLLLLLLGLYFFPTFNPFPHSRRISPISAFLIAPSDFLPPPARGPPPAYLPSPVSPKREEMVVPNSVHYVYGLKPVKEGEEAEELPYYAYLAMRSALVNLKPEVIYFHYDHLPTGPWWDAIVPHLTLQKTVVPQQVMGRPISHFAHKADVLRLLAMKHSGGIYLDIDIYVLRSFNDLLYHPTTLGMEAATDSRRSELDPEGLCNAVIISAPHSPFIDRWISSYETFDEGVWAHHSVVVPWELARQYPQEIQVLSEKAFFWPMWYGEEIQYTHERDDYDFYATNQYTYHAWESLAMGYLGSLSPEKIMIVNNSFNRMVRPFIGENDDEIYRRWKGHG